MPGRVAPRPAAEALRVQANWHNGTYAAALRLAADWIDRPGTAPLVVRPAALSLSLAERVVDSYGPRRVVLVDAARALLSERAA